MSAPSVEATPDQVLYALGGSFATLVAVIVVALGWRRIGNRNERRAKRTWREAQRPMELEGSKRRHPAGKGLGR